MTQQDQKTVHGIFEVKDQAEQFCFSAGVEVYLG